MDKLKLFLSNRTNLILVGSLLLIVIGLFFGAQKLLFGSKQEVLEEVDLPFDPDGPYALLVPRRDGNALFLNINRVSSYDAISYELTYQSKVSEVKNADTEEGSGSIDRGVQGTIDTKSKKGEYQQEILFGTCSQGYTDGASHCVFDKGVENGTLLLKIQKGKKLYKMLITWHLQKPDISLGVITSADGHFTYKADSSKDDLVSTGYTIMNDLSGVPKLPEGKQVLGKVYGLNMPTAKSFPKGEVTIELAEKAASEVKIARYNDSKNNWEILDTKINASKLSAFSDGAGVFAVLANSSK